MASGYDKADWTVVLQPLGRGGSVLCGTVHGVFGGRTSDDSLHINYVGSNWSEGADFERMRQAAEAAARDALENACQGDRGG